MSEEAEVHLVLAFRTVTLDQLLTLLSFLGCSMGFRFLFVRVLPRVRGGARIHQPSIKVENVEFFEQLESVTLILPSDAL
uniref:hypothetical protein n=1 Tax=Enterobacter asburiae TaxID=61645 RepID=UPI001E4069C0|nr:hypothetical protein [Enterobacter asburiae]